MKNDVEFKPGDTVKVHTKVVEGNTERIQVFDGTVISVKPNTFTVRKISYGVGVERIFPHRSPRIDRIEVVKKGKVRRAKLYYLRELTGKAANVREIKKAGDESAAPPPKKISGEEREPEEEQPREKSPEKKPGLGGAEAAANSANGK